MSEFGPYSNENGSSGLVGCVNEMAQRDRLSVEKLTHVIEELVREESQDEDSEGFSHSTDNQSRISLNTDENGRNSLTHSRFSLLTDIRWRNASIEPYRIVKADTVEVFDELPGELISYITFLEFFNFDDFRYSIFSYILLFFGLIESTFILLNYFGFIYSFILNSFILLNYFVCSCTI